MRIVYFDCDTLRPDHLGCYGYQRNTSPNIDTIAGQGLICNQCYTSNAPCLPSRSALFTGRFGIHTGIVGHGGTAADHRLEGSRRGFASTLGLTSWPEMMRRSGYRTATVSPFASRHSAWWFVAGFNEVFDPGKRGMEIAPDVCGPALDWLNRNASSDNWFLHVNLWDPHMPYRTGAEFGEVFKDAPLPQWMTEDRLREHNRQGRPHGARELGMYGPAIDSLKYPRTPSEVNSMSDYRKLIDGYDTGIKYMDKHIGLILNRLADLKVLDDTAIIISADHGENLGELGIYSEHATADGMTCRIPLIIKWPGGAAQQDDALHYNLDLPPTILTLLNIDPPEGWDGRSFKPTLLSGETCGRDHLVLTQCAHVCQYSVRFGDWHYIRTYHDGYHLFPTDMLFNLVDDYHETANMAEEQPDIVHKGMWLLENWRQEQMLTMEHPCDPVWTVIEEGGPFHARGYLEMFVKRLRDTGRDGIASELLKKYDRQDQ